MNTQQRTWPWLLAVLAISCATAFTIGRENTRTELEIALWRGYQARVLSDADRWR